MNEKKIYTIGEGDEFYGVRFRQPSQFKEIRTPDWAEKVAQSESKGAKVRMGKTEAGNWFVESVLIEEKYRSKEKARELARRIRQKIEEEE